MAVLPVGMVTAFFELGGLGRNEAVCECVCVYVCVTVCVCE